MTRPPATSWSPGWSTTPERSSTPSTASTLDDEQQQLVGLLALVAGQDVEEGDQPGSWRIARKVAKDRVISTVDPETRHMHKSRSNYRDGYKAHLAVEPETGIITDVELTPANTGDGPVGVALLDDETTPAGGARRLRLRVRPGARRPRRAVATRR